MTIDRAGAGDTRGYRAATLIALFLAPVLVVVISGLLFASLSSVAATRAAVERSYQTREQIQRVFSLLQDAETGQRGFIITGQDNFLEPYRSGTSELGRQLGALDALLAGEADQQARMVVLKRQVQVRLQALAYGIELRRRGAAEAQTFVAAGQGKAAMDAIRVTVAGMIVAESDRLERKLATARSRAVQTRLAAGAMVAALILSLIAAAFLVHRHTRARQQLMEGIEQARARQLGIFESTMDAIVTLNPSGSIETINRAAETMFGYERAELLRRDASLLVDLAPGEGLFLRRLALRGGTELSVVREYVGRRKDGSTFPAEVALGAMNMRDGVHVVAAVRDVTERKAAERLKDEFVSTVSHELRTPLTSIAGSLGLLEGGAAGPLPEKAARLVHIAKTSCDRLVRLINDLLDVQKIASGQVRFDMRAMDLGRAAARAREGMEGFAQERQVRIAYSPPAAPLMVTGDEDRLIQVAANLLSNAIKFSPAGGVVELTVEEIEHRAVLRVRDHGPGVPEAFQAHLFRKFAQADGSAVRSVGGSGLGLAISREIAERHNGLVGLAQTGPDGSVFEMSLPLARLSPKPEQAARRLLLCAHDPAVLAGLSRPLAEDGFEVLPARSIGEAEAALRQRAFAVVLLDLNLPDGDGLTLARRLRADPAFRSTPIVVLTGEDAQSLSGLPVADWIVKPVDIERLRSAVGAALGSGHGQPTILHVDDDLDLTEVVETSLADWGRLEAVATLEAARTWLAQRRPNLVILDVGLPDGSGLELLPLLGERGPPPPVIIYSGQEVDAEVVDKVEAVLTKSRASFESLTATVRALTRQQETAG